MSGLGPSEVQRPTLGVLRRRDVDPPYRPQPALPGPARPTLGALRHPTKPNFARVEALDWLRWSLAVDAARTIAALVATGWDRAEAVALYSDTMLDLVADSISFGASWSEVTGT